MTSMRSPARLCPHRTIGQGAASVRRAAFAVVAMGILSACEQNTFVPPPPAKVDVAVPVQRPFTRYLEATGNTAAIQNVDLVARVQGFLQSINYKDGAYVKEGTSLFTIEPDTYKLKLEQAQAAETGAQASVKQAEAGFPHKGRLDYAAATLNQSTGTLPVRGVLPNSDRVLLPGFFVRVRVPVDQVQNALFVPDVALGSDQAGRYVLVANGENIVEQRKVRVGPLEGVLRVIEEGLKADDRVITAGLLRAIPGQKVDPQLKTIEAQP